MVKEVGLSRVRLFAQIGFCCVQENCKDIAQQLVLKQGLDVDIIMGGGKRAFLNATEKGI